MNLQSELQPKWETMVLQYDGQYGDADSAYQYLVLDPSRNNIQMGRFTEEEIEPYLIDIPPATEEEARQVREFAGGPLDEEPAHRFIDRIQGI
jgi:hypothetical protein